MYTKACGTCIVNCYSHLYIVIVCDLYHHCLHFMSFKNRCGMHLTSFVYHQSFALYIIYRWLWSAFIYHYSVYLISIIYHQSLHYKSFTDGYGRQFTSFIYHHGMYLISFVNDYSLYFISFLSTFYIFMVSAFYSLCKNAKHTHICTYIHTYTYTHKHRAQIYIHMLMHKDHNVIFLHIYTKYTHKKLHTVK